MALHDFRKPKETNKKKLSEELKMMLLFSIIFILSYIMYKRTYFLENRMKERSIVIAQNDMRVN